MTTPNQPPLLRGLIHIPEEMGDSDFVLKLAERTLAAWLADFHGATAAPSRPQRFSVSGGA
ncbi:hypothetical protein FHR32_001491 [Streptosporangium album]|uniref:Uncharacterized protein n=1 Tax=Streptosporangium album TaxID=47479 RepID=A0A7W7W7W6_9ACTN|nr:hypothetical protein [Streptosporangium album]MBB4937186.1 hypothetical protein [Streptosporangium album]